MGAGESPVAEPDSDLGSITALSSVESKPSTDEREQKETASLEYSFDVAFAKARQYAYTRVIQRLNPLQPWHSSKLSSNTSCTDTVWKGYPIQEDLLRACHFYTTQWLSERDTTRGTEPVPVARLMSGSKYSGDSEEDDLVKAVGAWSLDLKNDCAEDALLTSSEVNTVPGGDRGLVDATLQRPSQDEKKMIRLQHTLRFTATELSQNTGQMPTSDLPLLPGQGKKEKDHYLSIVNNSEANTQSESDHLNEQVERIYPVLIHPVQSWGGCPGINSVPGSTYVSSGNSRSQISRASSGGSRTENNIHKRKRDGRDQEDDDNNNGENSSDDDRAPHYKLSKSMPLEDPSAKLACHFYMLDKQKYCEGSGNGKRYKTCTRGFRDSKELKDHHKKQHYGPKYLCSNCHQDFDNSALKASHEKQRPPCEPREDPEFAEERYILIGTQRRDTFENMKKRKDTSHEKHWLEVWDVLFPGQTRPPCPYMPRSAFDAAFSRIAKDEINAFCSLDNHETLARDRVETKRLLLELFQRVRQRLSQESRAGMLYQVEADLTDNRTGTQAEEVQTQANQIANSQATSARHLMLPHQNRARTRLPRFNDGTTLPLQEHYSASGWANYPVPTGSSNGSQPSYNTPQSNNVSFASGENDTGLDGQPNNNYNYGPTNMYFPSGPFGGYMGQ